MYEREEILTKELLRALTMGNGSQSRESSNRSPGSYQPQELFAKAHLIWYPRREITPLMLLINEEGCKKARECNNHVFLTFSMMQTREMALPACVWYSSLPRMKAVGTSTCRLK